MRIRSQVAVGAAFAVVLALGPSAASAVVDVGAPGTERLDVRRTSTSVRPTDVQVAAVRDLLGAAGAGARVSWDPRFGTPRSIRKDGGWLTGPRSGDPVAVARAFIDANREAFGLSAADVAALVVVRDHELVGTGTRVVNFAQTYTGLPAVRGGRLGVAVAGDGRILSYAGNSARNGGLAASHKLSAAQALQRVADRLVPGVTYTPQPAGDRAGFQVFAKGPFAGDSYVQKAAFPTRDGARPAYRVLFVKALDQAWDTVIDAGKHCTKHRWWRTTPRAPSTRATQVPRPAALRSSSRSGRLRSPRLDTSTRPGWRVSRGRRPWATTPTRTPITRTSWFPPTRVPAR